MGVAIRDRLRKEYGDDFIAPKGKYKFKKRKNRELNDPAQQGYNIYKSNVPMNMLIDRNAKRSRRSSLDIDITHSYKPKKESTTISPKNRRVSVMELQVEEKMPINISS